MTSQSTEFFAHLFYSYCHKDARHRTSMEKSLALIKQEGLLKDWSDRAILPGQSISKKIKEEMDKADIMAFLLSPDFIASQECMKEWNRAKELTKDKLLFRIPIIVRDCTWKDLLNDDDIRVLPTDGRPVAKFGDRDTAWLDVYEGIKVIINELRSTFTPKSEFLEEMRETDIPSQQRTKIQDIFVFPSLSCYTSRTTNSQRSEEDITNQSQLLAKKFALIHGEEMSGKTALGRHLFLSLVERSAPVLHMDLHRVPKNFKEEVLHETYRRQFT